VAALDTRLTSVSDPARLSRIRTCFTRSGGVDFDIDTAAHGVTRDSLFLN
jgi:hypothetical protein